MDCQQWHKSSALLFAHGYQTVLLTEEFGILPTYETSRGSLQIGFGYFATKGYL